MDLVTIIMPVYNNSKYLPEMLQGVSSQSYVNWELILVDDGSTDGSGAICDEFCKQEDRARVFHQCNRGQAAARDSAISQARGQWLLFADADDVLHPKYVECLITAAHQNNVDIVECDFIEFDDEVPPFNEERHGIIKVIRGQNSVAQIALDCKTMITTLWCKLFRSTLFNNVRCPEGQLYEDEYLIPRIYSKANSYCLIADQLYCYRQHMGSTMASAYDEGRALANIGVFEDRFITFYGQFGAENDGVLLFRHVMLMCMILERIRLSKCNTDFKDCISHCLDEIRDKGVQCLNSRCVPIPRKMLVVAAMVSPRIISLMRGLRGGITR